MRLSSFFLIIATFGFLVFGCVPSKLSVDSNKKVMHRLALGQKASTHAIKAQSSYLDQIATSEQKEATTALNSIADQLELDSQNMATETQNNINTSSALITGDVAKDIAKEAGNLAKEVLPIAVETIANATGYGWLGTAGMALASAIAGMVGTAKVSGKKTAKAKTELLSAQNELSIATDFMQELADLAPHVARPRAKEYKDNLKRVLKV